ncbi:MAG: Amuc_1100 family pilus-like protein [Verrucomicrobiota bacterium]
MNHKIWLIIFGVVAALLVGGSGFYALSNYGKYSDSLSGWEQTVGTIGSLERRVPYPNKENSEALEEEVKAYQTAVDDLYQSLNSFQRELDYELEPTQFQQRVKERVQEFRKLSSEVGLTIEGTEGFQLGFDTYSNTIPPKELVPILDYELDAIDHLLRTLVDSGMESIKAFERDLIPGEEGSIQEHESGVVHKYPIRISFVGSYDAFQWFINKISNDKEFFYIVRFLKVQNQAIEGPQKTTGDGAIAQGFIHSDTGSPAQFEDMQRWGFGDRSEEEVAQAAAAEGFVASQQDARVLMGQERLDVFIVVDIARFLSPQEVAEAGKKESEEGSKR